MTQRIRCDSCGDIVHEETAHIRLNALTRTMGGNFYDPERNAQEWDHTTDSVDLCSSCAEPLIKQLNGML